MEIIGGLKGKCVIVTGGASGIGAASVQNLAISGCNILIADMNEEAGQALADDINKAGDARAAFIRTDVSIESDVKAMVDKAVSTFGRLDGAINAAGVPNNGKILHEMTAEEFIRVTDINLVGMFLCVKYQIQAMLENGGGSIVAISSTASIMGLPNTAEYCASKAGVNGLVRAASIDYAQKGIRINAILPGATWTPLAQKAVDINPNLKGTAEFFPMKRYAQPEEIAAPSVWLLSDQASYVTGTAIPIDGALSV
ncbi:2,5-dichloro-2,5-cyclohexadiene-1,4-diol dehydrogenase 1 [Sphingobium faniae]|nr:2,5-dichloro-2,5-cyclohexadiene-1,4-diol dehydrogenase 1 [Sphingobium faniae]